MKYLGRSLAIPLFGLILASALLFATTAKAQTVTATVTVGAGFSETAANAVAVNPVTNKIYVTNPGTDTVNVIDGATNTTTTVTVGNTPVSASVNTLTNKIYIANAGSSNVTVIDGATNATTTVKTGANPDSMAIDPVTNKIYVANQGSDTVTVIDGATNTTTTLTVGASPIAAALNPVTNKIYVANNQGSSVTVIDGATNATTTVAAGTTPAGLAVNPVTNKIYVTNFNVNTVTVIDGATNATSTVAAGTSPFSLTLNPVTNRIYAANFNSSNMTVIDGATFTVLTTVATGTNPSCLAVDPITNTIFVTSQGGDNVTVIDGATNNPLPLAVSAATDGVAVNPVTNKIYVRGFNNTNLIVIDGATNATATVAAGMSPGAAAVNPVTNQIYVSNGFSNNVTVIDGATNATATVAVGTAPGAAAVNPVTNQIYVPNTQSSNVTVIDGATNATTTVTLPNANHPFAVAVNPVTNKIYVANQGSNNVTEIDGATNTTTTLAAGTAPTTVAVNPVTNKIYVANDTGTGTVTVIDGATNATTTVAVGDGPVAVAVNPVTNQIYVANGNSNNVTVIDGATNSTSTVTDPNAQSPSAVGVNPFTNQIYVANEASANVTVIDGATNTTTTVTTPNASVAPAVAVNPVTNKIYVANFGSNNVTVIDGATNTTTTVTDLNANSPFGVAVNPVTNKIYVANAGSKNVTVIDEQNVQTIPLKTAITPLAGNTTSNPTPTFSFTATSTFSPTATTPDNVLFQVDTWQGPWLAATNQGGGAFSGTAPTLSLGTHVLYAYATDGQDATSIMTTIFGGCSPVIGAISSYVFAVTNPATATHFSVTAPTSATAGTSFNFTVTAQDASNNTVTSYAGMVQFTSSDGAAMLPAASTLTNGVGNFPATLNTAGSQTITVTDTVTNSITGTSNNIAVTVPLFKLTVTEAGTGSGGVTTQAPLSPAIDCNPNLGTSSVCFANYNSGTSITLTATPNSGSAFAGWTGAAPIACTVSTNTCTFTMPTAAETVTATFNTTGGPTLVSIAVTPANPVIAVFLGTQQFTATGTFSSGPTQNITNSVTWTSSNANVATISNAAGSQGFATAVSTIAAPALPGATTITATMGTVSGSTSLVVGQVIVADFGADYAYSTGYEDKQRVDGQTKPLIVTLTNTSSTQTVNFTTVTADNPAYAVSTNCTTLLPGQTCTVSAAFTATSACQNQPANITVNDNDPGGNLIFGVNGYGADNAIQVDDLTDTSSLSAQALAKSLVGPGVTIQNVTYTGSLRAAGNFSSASNILGFSSGVALSSGSVRNVVGPNCVSGAAPAGNDADDSGISVDNVQPGDSDLTTLAGVNTYDAAVLEFDFIPTSSVVTFRYVFASDEYNEFVGQFNDVFGFFVNGTNVALVPGTNDPVSINNVNDGNPVGTNPVNPQYYINNEFAAPSPFDTEMNGLTVVFTAQAQVTPNQLNHIKLAIADAGDHLYDSNVFIQAQSLASAPVTLTPGTLAFGNQASGTTSASQPVTLTNNSTTALTISSIVASAGFTESNACPSQLAPAGQSGSSCTINVSFAPTSSMAFQGMLTVTDNQPSTGSQQFVTLSGTGTAPTAASILVSPSSLTFGATLVNTTSASQPVTISVSANSPASLTVQSITPPAGFTQSGGSCMDGPTSPGNSCTINVFFAPTTTGTITGNLMITDTATGSPQMVMLMGTSVSGNFTVLPSSLNFGSVTINTTSAPQPVTVTNGTTSTVLIDTIAPPDGFGQTSNCTSAPLAPNGTCTINVTFMPTSATAFSGNLLVSSTKSEIQSTVALTGTGINVPFTLTVGTPAGGVPGAPLPVTPGGQLAIPLLLTPVPGIPPTTVQLSCTSSAPQFLTCSPAPKQVMVSPNGTQVAAVVNTYCQGATPVNGPDNGPGGLGRLGEFLLAGLAMGSMALAYRRRSRWVLSFAALVLITLGSAACSSLPKGPSGQATPPGNYTLFITATANSQSVTVQVPILVVQ